MNHKQGRFIWLFSFVLLVSLVDAQAQDKIKIAYSSTDTLNQIWTIAQRLLQEKRSGRRFGLYRQHHSRHCCDRFAGRSSGQCCG
jgi:hypothetical protein